MTKITSIEQLKKICIDTDGAVDCFISLGFARSSKSIVYFEDTNTFSIINEIDGTEDVLEEHELFNETKTFVGKAINDGLFYLYDDI